MWIVGSCVSPGRNGSSLLSSRFLYIAFTAVSIVAQVIDASLPGAASSVFGFYLSLVQLLAFVLYPLISVFSVCAIVRVDWAVNEWTHGLTFTKTLLHFS